MVNYYLFAQAARAEAISCPANGGQRAHVFGRHSCSENPSLGLLLRFGKQVSAALIEGEKFLLH